MSIVETNFLSMFFAVAACEDYCKGRIPNSLVLFGATAGMIRAFISLGAGGMFCCILRAVLIGAFFYLFFMVKGLGAGDVKLLFVTGLWLDFGGFLSVVFTAFAAALIFALVRWIAKKRIREKGNCEIGIHGKGNCEIENRGKRNCEIGNCENRTPKKTPASPVKLAPAVLIGWVVYLGGINFV